MLLRSCRTYNTKGIGGLSNVRYIFSNPRLCDEKSSDDEPPVLNKKEEASKKLKDLLNIMTKKEPIPESAKNIVLPKAREKAQKKAYALKEELKQLNEEQIGNKLGKAAFEVAKSMKGNAEKTEKELLEIYFHKKSKQGAETPTEEKQAPVGLNELLVDMKVEKEQSRAHQVRAVMGDSGKAETVFIGRPHKRPTIAPIDIFGETPFGIFDVKEDKDKKVPEIVELPVWNYLQLKELKLAITHPPRNIFEQLILWTEQGKVWKFPIDNEQDWHEEQNSHFTEHVFLDQWIEPWCPESGPVRHFMELVCVGLSKNPFLTVEEKKAHLFWYEHYFRGKKQLLIDTNAGVIKDRPAKEQVTAE